MEEKNEQKNNWKSKALFFYTKTTGWIIGPIAGVMIIQKIFDFQSGYIFPVLIGLSFVVTCYGIYKEVKNYLKEL